jgi:hypothetical protein
MTFNLGAVAIEDFRAFLNAYGQSYTVSRILETLDSMGTVESTTETRFTVIAMIQDINLKDRQLHDMGIATPGQRKFYCLVDNYGNEIAEGDIVLDPDLYQWRITKILKEPLAGSSKVFKSCIVQHLGLKGTPASEETPITGFPTAFGSWGA